MKIKKVNDMSEYFFTKDEATQIVNESIKIGFKPQKFLVKDKEFHIEKVKGSIYLEHPRTGNTIEVEKYKLKFLGLDIFKDNMTDILFTLLLFQDFVKMVKTSPEYVSKIREEKLNEILYKDEYSDNG